MAMNTSPSPVARARAVMEAVAELHARGYGRLKLFSYVKEGLGAWRHNLFAASSFPDKLSELPSPVVSGSIPGQPIALGQSATELADDLLQSNPELAEAARGTDEEYVSWYRDLLRQYPLGILSMESPTRASMSGVPIAPPPGLAPERRET